MKKAIHKAIISGGGTGGHIFPAIAIADEIRHRNPKAEILFIGAEDRMEMDRVPKAGYEIVGLPIKGIQRKLTFENLKVPFRLWKSIRQVKSIIKDFNPEIVIGVGGYASGPTLWVATGLGIPTLVQEQNSYAGLTNKLLARRVNAFCVAYERMERFFPDDRITITGNPVRQDLDSIASDKEEALGFFDLNRNKKTILIFGGSLGARTLNESVNQMYDVLKEVNDVQVIWQCGKRAFPNYQESKTSQLKHIHLMPFIDRMDLAYQVADLVVCRAGALTISELAITGKASVLVPSPNVAEDHQTKNALSLVDNDAAIMIEDGKAVEKLIPRSIQIVRNNEELIKLRKNVLELAKPGARQNIVDIAEELIKE